MYFSEKEEKVVRVFYNNLSKYEEIIMILKWKNGSQVIATFDTCFEDNNELEMDVPGYEEYISFVFKAIDTVGSPPVYITEDECFCVDYRNFPDEIIADGKKIN